MRLLSIVLAVSIFSVTNAGFIEDAKLADWSLAGVPGGIPERSVICKTVVRSPDNPQTTQGSIAAGSTALVLSSGAADFQVGHGIRVVIENTIMLNVITGVNATHFTLTASGSTLTNGQVSHDDGVAINYALAECPANQIVYLPAGRWIINTVIDFGWTSNKTLRGAGESTVLVSGVSTLTTINIGSGSNYEWKPDAFLSASSSKGSSTLTFQNTTFLNNFANRGIGALVDVNILNNRTLPVIHVSGFERVRRQMSRIIASTETTVTIHPPLYYDFPMSLSPAFGVAIFQSNFIGLENFKLDLSNSASIFGVICEQCYASWFKNVTILKSRNYHIFMKDSVQCEVRDSWLSDRNGQGSNGASLLVEHVTASLFENNVLLKMVPQVEVNFGSHGNVFGYNLCEDSTVLGMVGPALDTNHGPHNSYNLYEGNVSPNVQADGYFGSCSEDIIFRNWLHGTSPGANPRQPILLQRFTRNYSIIGNILGHPNMTIYPYAIGYPNMGNGGSVGTAQHSKGLEWADWEKTPQPGAGGYQEMDLDVQSSTSFFVNFEVNATGGSVPINQALPVGCTLPDSLYLKVKPAWFGGLAFPPFGPSGVINKIPAQLRFANQPIPAAFTPAAPLSLSQGSCSAGDDGSEMSEATSVTFIPVVILLLVNFYVMVV